MSDDTIFDPEIHVADKDGNPKTNQDGSFRKRRGTVTGQRGNPSARGRRPRASTAPRKAAVSQQEKYAEGVAGLLQIPAAVLSFVDPVDGYCVAQHTPHIASSIAAVAVERPEVAAALDRVLAVGPYGALLGAVLPLAVQLAHNHGWIPEPMARGFGATPRRDIERHLKLVPAEEPAAEHGHTDDYDGAEAYDHAA